MTRSIREIWDGDLGRRFGTEIWDGFVTRSIREVIDFLMSILSTPFRVHADKTSNFVDLFEVEYCSVVCAILDSSQVNVVWSHGNLL